MDQSLQPNWRDDGFSRPEESLRAPPPQDPASPSHTVEDILYALFRRKWLIVTCSLMGLIAAAVVYKLTPKVYHSEARLLVKYVPEVESLGPGQGDDIRSPILRGETVVNSELDILTSGDLASKVAEVVGPGKILAAFGGGTNLAAAAMTVKGGVSAYAVSKANSIRVVYAHPDPNVVTNVLSELIAQYFEKHYQVHRELHDLHRFERERDQVGLKLADTEAKLRELMTKEGVFSTEGAKKSSAAEVESTQKAFRDAEMELRQLQGFLRLSPTNATPEKSEIFDPRYAEQRDEYAQLSADVERLRAREQASMAQGYKAQGGMVKPLRDERARLEARRAELEREFPELAGLALSSAGTDAADPLTNRRKLEILKITVATLQDRLAAAKAEEARLYGLADRIQEMERQKEIEEEHYRYFAKALDRAKFDAALGSSRDSNIGLVQRPTPPVSDPGALYKRLLMIIGAGVIGGIALALFIELFLDQRIKRPVEIRRLLPVPLFLSIPASALNGKRRLLSNGPSLPEHSRENRGNALALLSDRDRSSDRLQPYFEALRDRILNRFETNPRKPKLVGICGCAGASGNVTRLATGLAGALSEAGDLKVLLVDMKNRSGRPHPILGTRKSCSLAAALENSNQGEALIAPNLYVATAQGTGNQALATSPSKFTRVVPQLNASDYDYIVFDMPEVDEVSSTPRLAKHMDLMLLAVEAERAHRGAVKQAGSLLMEFTPNVAVVLNNTKAGLPNSLHHAA